MKYLDVIILLLLSLCCRAQRVVVDRQHLATVLQNGTVRSAAESTHEQYLSKISGNIDDLNTNMSSVVLAQTIIYESLSNVNSALKDGLAVRNMGVIIADMSRYVNQALDIARDQPYLLLFAGSIAAQMRTRATALVTDVSSFILKEGDNVLADYNARDQLLRKVTQQLQILDGLAYGAWKSIYWARQRGLMASATPFAAYLAQDQAVVNRIIQQAKYLKP
ncbi:hypothetical protein [Mucilaginibacter lacusdianchii]|uniref:hypothetical protein n=1 Tax=Mucilaginibacter lacusdianchii TaxID=2684211 RepID=UPI00131C2E59|nr:hypothetical protein [Mucilaginibacter sp. JXJ CY 39]